MFEPGSLIGRYEIQRKLGKGGMGAVYVAHDPQLGRMVAIKVLAGDVEEAEALERFKREARSAAALNHPNLVTVYDFDRFESQPYLVMEYVAGRTMADVIRRKEPVSLGEKLRWIDDLCLGAGYAHQMSVVHRDIKPANLMIARSGQLKILDFGIARMLGITSSTGTMIGTPGYMAPEQIEGEAIDQRADLFSIGVVFYELLAYREAFPGDTVGAITHKVLTREPTPLTELVSNLHPDLVAIVDRAMRKKPDERFENAQSLRSAVSAVRDALGAGAVSNAAALVSPGLAEPRPSGSERPSGSSSTPGGTLTPSPDRLRTDREAIARLRVAQLEAALERSRALLRAGALEDALEQCRIALTFDETYADAVALEGTIQSTMHQRDAEALLDEARVLLSRGAVTEARVRVQRAREMAPDVTPVKVVERELRNAVVEQERLRKRAETVAGMVESARVALEAGEVESSLASAREALALDPGSEAARGLEREALRRLEGTGPMSAIPAPGSAGEATMVRAPSSPVGEAEATVVRRLPTAPSTRTPDAPGPVSPRSSATRSQPIVAKRFVPPDLVAWARPLRSAFAGFSPALQRTGRSVTEGVTRARAWLPDARAMTAWPLRANALAAWGAIMAVVAGLILAVVMLQPPAVVPTGTVVVDAVPWGTITSIKGEDGESVAVPSPASTPALLTLPVGTYEILLAGPGSEPGRIVTVRIEPGGTNVAPVQRFTELTADEYFTPYLSVPAAAPDGAAPADAVGQTIPPGTGQPQPAAASGVRP